MKADTSSTDRIVPDLTRRDLFRTVGLATGGAMLLGLPKFMSSWTNEAEAAVATGQQGSLLRAALELDGIFVCFLNSVEGGNAFADVVPEAVGPDMIQRKRPGPVRFEDIVIDVALASVAKPLSNWINDTRLAPKNGVIVYADFNLTEFKRLEFFNAMLTEVTVLPANANSTNPALLTLRITPQTTRLAGSTGKQLSSILGKKNSLASNFRFNVQGLEKACSRISKVDSIVARRSVVGTVAGQDRLVHSAPGVLDCSIVRITLPEADAGPFYAWFDESVVKGKPAGERAGLLEWLDSTMKTVVASVQLGGLGIVRYAPERVDANSEQRLGLVQVDMYCETINLTIL